MAYLSDSNTGSRKRQADAFDLDESDETSPCTTPRSAPGEAPTSAASAFNADQGVQANAGDIATQLEDLPWCTSDLLLRDVADMLLSTGQTAVAVVGEMGVPEGVITEDDILRSYFQGAPWDATVAEWMRGGGGASIPPPAPSADAPEAAARALNSTAWSVPPKQPLYEAVGNLLSPPPAPNRDRTGAGSCVLLVQGDAQGCGGGILSPVEVARALAARLPQLAAEAAATVADVMEPLEEAPALAPGFTMRQLLQQLLCSPARAALVADGAGVRGLATAADAMWAFHQQIAHDTDAWERLSARPGRADLEGHAIPMDAPLQHAAAAMAQRPAAEAAPFGALRALLAVEPSSSSVVGLVSPSHLVKSISERSIPRLSNEQDAGQAQPPTPLRRLKLHKRRRVVRPHPVTVADIVAQRETATCLTSQTLADAADALVESGRTAAVVTNEEGDVRGVLTENDLLTALVEGAPWGCKIDTWLRGGQARLPGFMVPALTLTPETTLAEAAAEMMAQLEEGSVGTGFACHHLLVRSSGGASSQAAGAGDGPRQVRLLSALDLAKGMIDAVAAQAAGAPGGIEEDAVVETSDMTVEQAMKDRGVLAGCKLTDTLREAFEIMFESRQNCAVVVPVGGAGEGRAPAGAAGDGGAGRGAAPGRSDEHPCVAGKEAQDWLLAHGPVRGVVTAADALRCFSERQRGDNATVASWLRALTAAEHKTAAQRSIRADESLSDAALAMGMSEVHHLVVLDRDGKEVVGVLSALDIVCTLGACYRFDLASPHGV